MRFFNFEKIIVFFLSAKFSKFYSRINATNKVSVGLTDAVSKFIGRNAGSFGKKTGEISIVGKAQPVCYFLNAVGSMK